MRSFETHRAITESSHPFRWRLTAPDGMESGHSPLHGRGARQLQRSGPSVSREATALFLLAVDVVVLAAEQARVLIMAQSGKRATDPLPKNSLALFIAEPQLFEEVGLVADHANPLTLGLRSKNLVRQLRMLPLSIVAPSHVLLMFVPILEPFANLFEHLSDATQIDPAG